MCTRTRFDLFYCTYMYDVINCHVYLYECYINWIARSKTNRSTGGKNPMITCLESMVMSDHICVGSVDCALTIYDKRNLEVSWEDDIWMCVIYIFHSLSLSHEHIYIRYLVNTLLNAFDYFHLRSLEGILQWKVCLLLSLCATQSNTHLHVIRMQQHITWGNYTHGPRLSIKVNITLMRICINACIVSLKFFSWF